MDQIVRRDIVSVLTKAVFLIEKYDFADLKELSNHTIHNASIVQDKYSIQTAIVIYALSKILERAKQKGLKISGKVQENLHILIKYVTDNNEQGCDSAIKAIFDEIEKIDERFPWHVQDVIDKAHVVKGSNMYRHGISIERVASILGITQWDLMSYIGKTRIIDKEKEVGDVKTRIDFARGLFNV